MLWKKINKIPFKNVANCLKAVKKKSICSHWIIDIFERKKKVTYSKYKNLNIHRVSLRSLGFKNPTTLKEVYSRLKKNYQLIPPEISLYLRMIYTNQPKGEWLRIAVPLNSMVDSDKVPHLPKLGCALGKKFIETYWSYPKAIFHPHNDFLVIKKNDI